MNTRQKNVMFTVLCTTCFLLAFLSTALNTALPDIASDFAMSASTAQWVVSCYALMLAIVMPLTAFLVKRFSSRKLYLAALACYLACCIACVCVHNFGFLIAVRVIQACANGCIASLTQVSILSIFPKEQRGQRMGWFGLSVGVAPIIAPALGGFFVDFWGWRSIFAFAGLLFFVDLLVSAGAVRCVLDTHVISFDALGFISSVIGLGGITLGLGNLVSIGPANPASWGPLLLGCTGIALFSVRELHCPEPLLNVRVLGRGKYRMSVIASAALYAAMMGSAAVLPVFVQNSLGTGALTAGLIVLPGALAMALVNPLAGKVLDRYGIRKLAASSAGLLVLGNVLLCVPALGNSLIAQTLCCIMRCIAIGLVQMPLMVWGTSELKKGDLPSGTALLTCLRNAGGAVGTAVFIGVLGVFGIMGAYAGMGLVSLGVLCPLLVKGQEDDVPNLGRPH